jgi:hypothetical protein
MTEYIPKFIQHHVMTKIVSLKIIQHSDSEPQVRIYVPASDVDVGVVMRIKFINNSNMSFVD